MYNIEHKTPGTNWHTIHKGWPLDSAIDFLWTMGEGGYSWGNDVIAGDFDRLSLTANYYTKTEDGNEGDKHEYRAIQIL